MRARSWFLTVLLLNKKAVCIQELQFGGGCHRRQGDGGLIQGGGRWFDLGGGHTAQCTDPVSEICT